MYRTYSILLFGCLLIASVSHSQTISGFVEDKSSGERLIGANVFDPDLNIGTSTNAYGFFSLTFKNLRQDSISLVVSYIGYESWRRRLAVEEKLHLEIRLQPTAILADTVTVEAEALGDITEQTEMSVVQIPVRQLTLMPALLGEVDVIKSLQLLPAYNPVTKAPAGFTFGVAVRIRILYYWTARPFITHLTCLVSFPFSIQMP